MCQLESREKPCVYERAEKCHRSMGELKTTGGGSLNAKKQNLPAYLGFPTKSAHESEQAIGNFVESIHNAYLKKNELQNVSIVYTGLYADWSEIKAGEACFSGCAKHPNDFIRYRACKNSVLAPQ